jgi:hypothetical protein
MVVLYTHSSVYEISSPVQELQQYLGHVVAVQAFIFCEYMQALRVIA